MNKYTVVLQEDAEKFYKKLAKRDRPLYERISNALHGLEREPYLGKPLHGDLKGQYSYRVGSYRIIYMIKSDVLLVIIIDIGHRREIYK